MCCHVQNVSIIVSYDVLKCFRLLSVKLVLQAPVSHLSNKTCSLEEDRSALIMNKVHFIYCSCCFRLLTKGTQ